jgi:PKD repeat protein
VVGGPDSGGSAKEKSEAGGKAGNVAESSAPKKPGKPAQKKPTGNTAASDEEAGATPDEAGAEAKVPVTVMYFDATKSSDPDGKVVQYDWDFDGDGVFDYSSHSSQYAKWPYYHNGDYTVVLKVADNGRYAQAGYGTNVVRIRNPRAEPLEFTAHITAYPPTGPCPLTVSYAASAIGGTAPYVYRWTFPDGSESTLANPFTTFPSAGPQSASFSVTDITGAKLTGTVRVQSCAGNTPATPQDRMAVDVSPPAMRGQAPYTARFDVSYDRGTAPVSYNVSFGDETAGQDPLVTAQSKFEHVYTNTGFYLVKIVATDAELRTASTFASVHAYTPEMARDFTPSAEGVGGDVYSFGHKMHIAFDYAETSPRMVRFTAKETPKPAEQLAYQWDFGDGTYSTDAKPSHTYAKDGVYEVRLTASDDVQRWRHRIWLPISSKPPAVAIQRPPYTEGPAPLRLNFDAIITRGEEPLKYEWSFGAGRRQDPSTFYVFEIPGDYKVELEVRDRYDQKIHAPAVEVRVRSGGASYRMPLSIIEPVSGSTRVALIDYNSAFPLPVSSPQIEGPPTLTGLSPDGQRVAIASEDGVIVKDVANAQPVVAFLPAAGKIIAVVALERDAAYCTVQTSAGPLTYLIRPACDPQLIGAGCVLDASGDGATVLLKPSLDEKAEGVSLYAMDVGGGQAGEAQPFGKAFDAQLSRDGHYAVFIAADERLVRRDLVGGKDEQLSPGDDRKTGLAIAADARAVVFDSAMGDRKDVIYGRYDDVGTFRLASVTDQTKFYSENLRLSADGQYLMAYGCREDVLALLKAVKGKTVADDELNGEASDKSVPQGKRPPASKKRYGLIRFDLSGSPDGWSITKVNPHFIVECTAAFDYAGPFE